MYIPTPVIRCHGGWYNPLLEELQGRAKPMATAEETFGERLRRYRIAAALSQETLAEKAGLSANAIGALERGTRKRPYPDTLRRLSDALGLGEDQRALLIGTSSRASAPSEVAPIGISSTQLPGVLTPLIGREREAAVALHLLAQPEMRLLTLTGPGGVGKTRLALHVADGASGAYPDGLVWVSLAPLRDPTLVIPTIARALGLQGQPGQDPRTILHLALRDRRALLALDNFEHLLDAAADLADLLLTCPGLDALVTSRAALGIRGEQEFPVPPLELPPPIQFHTPDVVAAAPAVCLFVGRAHEAIPSFALTAENATTVAAICRRLDGLPLALELAAARVKVLGLAELLARLDRALPLLVGGARDLPERQRTITDAIKWSYDLLGSAERSVFRRLAIFVGGWTLAAAEAIGRAGEASTEEVLDPLGRLVGQSLVQAEIGADGAMRYRLLEPVRQFAMAELAHSGEEQAVRRQHAHFFLALAEAARTRVRGQDQLVWLAQLDREYDNLRATLTWSLAVGEAEIAGRLGWALEVFWWIRGYQREGRRWMAQILTFQGQFPPYLQTRTLMAALTTALGEADDAAVEGYAFDLLALAEQLGGEAEAEAMAQTGLGLLETKRGEYEAAVERLEAVRALARAAGANGMAAQACSWIGTALHLAGDHDGAERRFNEGLAYGRSLGDRLGICNALFNLAQLALASGRYDEAARRFVQGLQPSREIGDRANVAYILEGLAVVVGLQGQAQAAATLLGAADSLAAIVGVRGHTYYQPDRALYERAIGAARARLSEEAFAGAEAAGKMLTLDEAIAYGHSVCEPIKSIYAR